MTSKTIKLKGKIFNSKVFSRKTDAVKKANRIREDYHKHIHLRVIKKKKVTKFTNFLMM